MLRMKMAVNTKVREMDVLIDTHFEFEKTTLRHELLRK